MSENLFSTKVCCNKHKKTRQSPFTDPEQAGTKTGVDVSSALSCQKDSAKCGGCQTDIKS